MFENLIKKSKRSRYSRVQPQYRRYEVRELRKKITSLLEKIPGIEKAVASVKDGKIDIVSSLPVVKETVEKAVKEAGFDFKGLIEKK